MDHEPEITEDHVVHEPGRLKIFLGAVAGVGKTYKMLSEARRRLSRGEDIVIGLVETHGRTATAELLEGFERIPLKEIVYRGAKFYEVDTAAVIARHPEWVIIDELAHTNAPGTVHEKRWQSINEIRDAGINVLTTLNIQHLESLNDVVFEVTGVRVKETVPDWVVDTADEIELVDLTPDAVINRLKRGDIYKGEKVPAALSGFFKKGNIAALRELALQKTAADVDEQLHQYMETHNMPQGKAVREYVTVCVAPKPLGLKLVRRGYRIAKRLQGDLDVVYVRVPGTSLSKREQAILDEIFALTKTLGGKVDELEGDSVAEEIIKYVNTVGATVVVMGQSARSRWQEIAKGSTINRIMRETKDMDILVVADTCETKETCE
jgi:two-component system sensor histidine kinase KdpD